MEYSQKKRDGYIDYKLAKNDGAKKKKRAIFFLEPIFNRFRSLNHILPTVRWCCTHIIAAAADDVDDIKGLRLAAGLH